MFWSSSISTYKRIVKLNVVTDFLFRYQERRLVGWSLLFSSWQFLFRLGNFSGVSGLLVLVLVLWSWFSIFLFWDKGQALECVRDVSRGLVAWKSSWFNFSFLKCRIANFLRLNISLKFKFGLWRSSKLFKPIIWISFLWNLSTIIGSEKFKAA